MRALLLIIKLIEIEVPKSAKMSIAERSPKRLAKTSIKAISIHRIIPISKNVNVSLKYIGNIFTNRKKLLTIL